VSVTATERGPIRGTITIAATYDLPTHIDPMRQRRTGSVSAVVTTTITLVADAPSVSVEVTFVNPSRDHRLRIHLPLPTPATESVAECAFGTVTRGLTAEGRPEELGLPTFPSRRFVMAGGLTVVHEGLNEYELIELDEQGSSARTLALTLVRSTGMLSRLGMTYRPFPAGPLTEVEGLQMVGSTVRARYVLGIGLDPWKLSEYVFSPLDVVKAEGGGDRPTSGTAFSVNGAIVSSIRRVAGELEVRVFNPTGTPTMVNLDGAEGFQVNLRGAPEAAFADEVRLGPYRFSTLRISDRDATHSN
jgi:alpha-mannosidase